MKNKSYPHRRAEGIREYKGIISVIKSNRFSMDKFYLLGLESRAKTLKKIFNL